MLENEIGIENEFVPDYTVSPGESLLETLETLGMSQTELARRTGRPIKTINEIIQAKVAITPETAIQLERVLGVPASYWLRMEQNYREDLARLQDNKALQEQLPWLRDVPVNEMVKFGWIKKWSDQLDQLREVLRFYAVASVKQWQVFWDSQVAAIAFRQSTAFKVDTVGITAWLRQGELEAQVIDCQPFDAARFRKEIETIRALTQEGPAVFVPELEKRSAACGVAVVFVPELPRTGVCGATRWLTSTKALIQLSLRYKTDDQLWFTFFHEAGHILLHGKRETFLEIEGSSNEKEQEADEFAANQLIPTSQLQQFLATYQPPCVSRAAIEQFANQLGIAPGIVVGRLQHDGVIPPQNCNGLKRRLAWAEMSLVVAD